MQNEGIDFYVPLRIIESFVNIYAKLLTICQIHDIENLSKNSR